MFLPKLSDEPVGRYHNRSSVTQSKGGQSYAGQENQLPTATQEAYPLQHLFVLIIKIPNGEK